jgi:hypothetical protein
LFRRWVCSAGRSSPPAAQYNDAAATPALRDAGVVFHAFHQYIGVAVGEHLGYLLPVDDHD